MTPPSFLPLLYISRGHWHLLQSQSTSRSSAEEMGRKETEIDSLKTQLQRRHKTKMHHTRRRNQHSSLIPEEHDGLCTK